MFIPPVPLGHTSFILGTQQKEFKGAEVCFGSQLEETAQWWLHGSRSMWQQVPSDSGQKGERLMLLIKALCFNHEMFFYYRLALSLLDFL